MIHRAASILIRENDFRVWSVLVTLFGDLAENQGDQISGQLLSRLTLKLGIRSEAMRVALHRLRKDGWLVSRKTGRNSDYQLTDIGFHESQAARARIYAKDVPFAKSWHLLIAQPNTQSHRLVEDQKLADKGYLVLGNGAYLGQGEAPETEGKFLCVQGKLSQIPNWVQAAITPSKIGKSYASLLRDLETLEPVMATTKSMSALQIAALRVLIIHNWRRILLRHPELPDQFFPENWPGATCRTKVMSLLKRLERPSLTSLHKL